MASVFSLWAHDVSRRILKLGRAPFTLTCWPVISAQGPTLCSYCLSGRKNGVPHMKRGCNSVPGEPPLAPPGLWLWSDIRSEPIWVTKLFKRSFQKKKKKRSKTTKLHSLDQTADRSCYCHVGSSQNLKPNQMWSTWPSCSLVSSLHSISRVLSLSASSSTVIWLVFLWLGWRCSGSRLAFLLWLIEVAPLCVSVPQGEKMSSDSLYDHHFSWP